MANLTAAQRLFGASLVDDVSSDDALRLFAGTPAHIDERLAIYRGNISANAGRALAHAYPVVRQLVGQEFFEGLAREFVRAFPARSGDLNEYGRDFAHFLDAFPHVKDLPYLPDVARLDWRVHRAHYAADAQTLDACALGRIAHSDYARVVLALHPAVALLASEFPIGRIWEVHQAEYRGEIAVDLDTGAQQVLVHRPQFRPAVSILKRGEAAFLRATVAGAALSMAFGQAIADHHDFDLAASLHEWIAGNVIVDFSIRD